MKGSTRAPVGPEVLMMQFLQRALPEDGGVKGGFGLVLMS